MKAKHWQDIIDECGLNGKINVKDASKRFANKVMKYKTLAKPSTGAGIDNPDDDPQKWKYFSQFDSVFHDRFAPSKFAVSSSRNGEEEKVDEELNTETDDLGSKVSISSSDFDNESSSTNPVKSISSSSKIVSRRSYGRYSQVEPVLSMAADTLLKTRELFEKCVEKNEELNQHIKSMTENQALFLQNQALSLKIQQDQADHNRKILDFLTGSAFPKPTGFKVPEVYSNSSSTLEDNSSINYNDFAGPKLIEKRTMYECRSQSIGEAIRITKDCYEVSNEPAGSEKSFDSDEFYRDSVEKHLDKSYQAYLEEKKMLETNGSNFVEIND